MLQSLNLEATQMVTGSHTGSHRVTQMATELQQARMGPTAGGASVGTDPATNSSRHTAGF